MSPRLLVYLQLLAVGLSVVFGQSERWRYAAILAAYTPFIPLVLVLGVLIPVFPVAMIVAIARIDKVRVLTGMALPLSVLMSVTQFLALAPLFS